MDVKSMMLPLGSEAPDFSLQDVVTGRTVSRSEFEGTKALLVMFICRHCPFVKHVREEIAAVGRDYAKRDVGIVAISANDPEVHPEDAPASLAEDAIDAGYTFPVLFDETQDVAKSYTAASTPEFFLFDAGLRLVYRGQMDRSRPRDRDTPGNGLPVTGEDLRAAIDAVLEGRPVSGDQPPSVGCGIAWHPGNEPAWG
jgi:peroxiredoxin